MKRRDATGRIERAEAGDESGLNGDSSEEQRAQGSQSGGVWREEGWNLVLLVVLYMIQGVPLGLTMGSMPYLLQERASYTQIGIFSIAAYPYSFKLFWSPIVDSLYSAAYGQRKSWIVPIQATTAGILVLSADWVQRQVEEAHVVNITALFFVLVLLVATQDIAVDGWAISLLQAKNVGYASTCQTVGMNIGYFTSFTVFLALNDPSFCNAYLRAAPQEAGVLQLGSYLRVWGALFGVVTLGVALGKAEAPPAPGSVPGLRAAYGQLLGVARLRSVQQLGAVLLTMRLGVLAAEGASALKLLEKGVSKESLAALVLIDFPCGLISAVVAGRWASGGRPFEPWMMGMWLRLACGAASTALVAAFPSGGSPSPASHPGLFAALAAIGLTTSFSSTLMFTALGSFFNAISDPAMGGAYMTLLNTVANMGIVLPKLAMFWAMDALTRRGCQAPGGELLDAPCPASHEGAAACVAAGGACTTLRDGFFPLSYSLLVLGVALGLVFRRALPALQARPLTSWRAESETSTAAKEL